MERRKIVVVVEDVDAARTAAQWALHNLIRCGDLIILLHVFSPSSGSIRSSSSSRKLRNLRLRGFQLALSFKSYCDDYPNTKVDIVVREGDAEGRAIAEFVKEIGAFALVVGLHDRSFLYRLATDETNSNSLKCRVLAIKQPPKQQTPSNSQSARFFDSSTNMDFSQIEISGLEVPMEVPQKIPYQICPNPSGILWLRPRHRPHS
uniref:UspA domain-containing protein n=1 Tax=Kalanchoe fedtschenkoi TaxID=63787 RepID=A0A7N0V763_KALFE